MGSSTENKEEKKEKKMNDLHPGYIYDTIDMHNTHRWGFIKGFAGGFFSALVIFSIIGILTA